MTKCHYVKLMSVGNLVVCQKIVDPYSYSPLEFKMETDDYNE
jgi:hypothetical protein